MEHVPYAPPPALRGFSNSGRLGLPLHPDPVRGQMFPYRRFACLPFHGPLGACDYSFEPAFIRKRNERERHRVRCVNEGYARLRERLPRELEDQRLSKVETLRAAIDYIKRLQGLLDFSGPGMQLSPGDARNGAPPPPQRTERSSDGESTAGLSDSG